MNATTTMTREEERAFIEEIRALHAVASSDVTDCLDAGEHVLEGRIIPQAERSPIAIFHPESDYRDVAFYRQAHKAVGVLLRSRDRLIDYYNKQNPQAEAEPEPGEPFDYARDCGIYCGKPMFQKYMMLVHGLEHPEDRIRMGTKMRSLLGVKSRTELNTDEVARDRWLDLRAKYQVWKDARL